MMIPCLCSFAVLSRLFSKSPVNKKRTRTLLRKESGSGTNGLVVCTGLEPFTDGLNPPQAAAVGKRRRRERAARKRKKPQDLRGLEPFSVGLNPPQAAAAGKPPSMRTSGKSIGE